MSLRCFATCPSGFADLLEAEVVASGGTIVVRTVAGIGFTGELEAAYRLCLWSRIANRVLLVLGEFSATDGESLYAGCQRVHWLDHLPRGRSIAVDFTSTRSTLTHTLYGAQRVKDAVVDQLRAATGHRPDVDVRGADLRINVHVERDHATLGIDLSGESLHRRGYRLDGGAAPLKENLAAGLLQRAGWPGIARDSGAFLDPMCGAGTIAIEALLMAADIAPGLLRRSFGFERWCGHDATLWQRLRQEADARREAGLGATPPVHASDRDPVALSAATANVERAGIARWVALEERALADVTPPAPRGLLLTNPPYGERLDDVDLPAVFETLGHVLRTRFDGWRAAVLTPEETLGFHTGLRVTKKNKARNGPIDVVLLTFDVTPERRLRQRSADREQESAVTGLESPVGASTAPDSGAEDFANRIRKNRRRFENWARRHDVTCYRVYDADLPDYAFAIDVYHGDRETWICAQEYAPPKTVAAASAERRREAVRHLLPSLFEVPPANVSIKVRERQRGGGQYEKRADTGVFHEVREGGCRFLVNFTDYLDTGLFLDHRPLRARIAREAQGARFLNLFAYTATATVHAARGGAVASVSVDLSNTYLDWAQRNLRLNDLDPARHRLVRAECRAWLARAAKQADRFDLVLLDPPSFSKSKAASGVLNVQRDHVALIRAALAVLAPGGTLYFSNNFQQFRLDAAALADLDVQDITRETIDEDFRRNPRIHGAWRIRAR
jgi:23S rRNA (guanine2445-N2)-methyltransferase / 23S rRNA (guanine2069-N7)-methyltransferase